MQNTYQDLITDIQSKNPQISKKLEGGKKFNRYRKLGQNHKIESVGNQLRKMMPWIEKNKIVR